ncbi:ParA family protein [Ornatilinea apprima]|nr:ParA family protein [Ornatilinea apprima]
MTQTIAISNQKGGVGKTTTCASIGAALVKKGARVLLVDLDSQASLSVALGQAVHLNDESIADLLDTSPSSGELSPADLIHPTSLPGLDIALGDPRLAVVEHHLPEQTGYEHLLKNHLQSLAAGYDFVLQDCSPSLGPLTIMALTAANQVIVPVQPDYLAAWGIMRLMETIEAVHQRTNPHLQYRILAVMYDQRNTITREMLNRLQQNFNGRIFKTIIGVDTRVRECAVTGEPLLQYAPSTRASKQYLQAAGEYLQWIGSSEG